MSLRILFTILSFLSFMHCSFSRADVRSELRAALQSRVKTFSRPVSLFHYGNRGPFRYSSLYAGVEATPQKINQQEAMDLRRGSRGGVSAYRTPVEISAPEAQVYFKAMAEQFLSSDPDWNVGQGLYAAVDPVQSESSMGNPWFLLKINVPTGLIYLDVRTGGALIVPDQFIQKYVVPESGREFERYEGGVAGPGLRYLPINTILELPKLKRTFSSLLEEFKVDALAYPWALHSIGTCRNLSHQNKLAFNFINPLALKRGLNLEVFVQNLEANADPEKKQAYAEVLDLIESSSIEMHSRLDPAGNFTWTAPFSPARLLTLTWSEVLHRDPVLKLLFPEPEEIAVLQKFFLGPVPGAKLPALRFDPTYFSEDETALDHSSGMLWVDPLRELSSSHPSFFEQRLDLIKKRIFACNADFPEEFGD